MDGALGRWFGIDALAEEYPSISPYVYAMNNPIFLIDPDGMRVDSSYLVNTETNVVTPIDDRGGNAVDYIYFWNGKPLAEEGGRMDLLVKNVEPVYTNEVYSPSQSRIPGYIVYNNRMPPSGASSAIDDPITGGISKATFGTLGLLYGLLRNAPKGGKFIVIGEGMQAVKTTAKTLQSQGINAKWYQAWTKNFPNDRLMTPAELSAAQARNAKWLNTKINQGYKIYDIGIDVTRATRSPFYQLERSILQQRSYQTISIKR